MTPKDRWNTYLGYLKMKIEERDWHGVVDAAVEIRVLEEAHPHLKPNPLSPNEPRTT